MYILCQNSIKGFKINFLHIFELIPQFFLLIYNLKKSIFGKAKHTLGYAPRALRAVPSSCVGMSPSPSYTKQNLKDFCWTKTLPCQTDQRPLWLLEAEIFNWFIYLGQILFNWPYFQVFNFSSTPHDIWYTISSLQRFNRN